MSTLHNNLLSVTGIISFHFFEMMNYKNNVTYYQKRKSTCFLSLLNTIPCKKTVIVLAKKRIFRKQGFNLREHFSSIFIPLFSIRISFLRFWLQSIVAIR